VEKLYFFALATVILAILIALGLIVGGIVLASSNPYLGVTMIVVGILLLFPMGGTQDPKKFLEKKIEKERCGWKLRRLEATLEFFNNWRDDYPQNDHS